MATGTSGIRAGRAFVELLADDSKLQQVLTRARNKIKGFGEGIKNIGGGLFDGGAKLFGAGAAIAGPLVAAGKVFSTIGDDLAKMSARTGMSVEALSELRYAADLSATSLEAIEGAMRKLQVNLTKADEDGKSAADALADIGLSADALSKLSPDEQFNAVADAIAGIQDPAQRTAFAMRVMGKSATELLPMFSGGAAGIKQMRDRARELGLTMSGQTAKDAEALNDALGEMWLVLKNVATVVGSELSPMIQAASGWITNMAVTTTNWIKEHGDAVRMALAFGAGLMVVGAAAVIAGKLIVVAGAGVTAIAGAIGAAQAVMAGAAAVLGVVFSPVGLAVAAVTAAVVGLGYVALKVFPQIGQAITGALAPAFDWVSKGFAQIATDATDAWAGISAAMASGDLGAAGKVGLDFLKIQWLEFKAFVLGLWITVRDAVTNVMADIGTAFAKMSEFAGAAMAGILTGKITEAMDLAEKAIKKIDADRKAEAGDTKQKSDDERAKLLADIEAARAEFQNDIAKAKASRGLGGPDLPARDFRSPEVTPPSLDQVKARNSTRGIFGGAAAIVLQSGDANQRDVQKKIEKNTAKAAETGSQMLDWIKANPGTYSFQ